MRKEGWKGRLDTFLFDLESGKFDPDFRESEAEHGSSMKENATNGENVTGDANGAPVATEDSKTGGGDDDMQFNMEAEEDGADHDANRAETNGKVSLDNKRVNRGEEISVPPEGNQVMIRTIPPDIGRVKLEEVRVPESHGV